VRVIEKPALVAGGQLYESFGVLDAVIGEIIALLIDVKAESGDERYDRHAYCQEHAYVDAFETVFARGHLTGLSSIPSPCPAHPDAIVIMFTVCLLLY